MHWCASWDARLQASTVMTTSIILPYDASPLAKLTLRKTAARMRDGDTSSSAGIVLAIAGIDPTDLDDVIEETRRVARAHVSLEVRLLNAGDPIADLHELIAAIPGAVLVAPVGVRGVAGRAPWYAEACRFASVDRTLLLFLVTPEELRTFEESDCAGQHREGSPLARLL